MLLEIGAAAAAACAVTACLFIRGATRKKEPDGEEPGRLRSLSIPGGAAYGYQPCVTVAMAEPPRPVRRKGADEATSEAARFVDCQGWVNVYETYHGATATTWKATPIQQKAANFQACTSCNPPSSPRRFTMEMTQATNDQAAETKEQADGHFRTWCAAVEMACTVLGPRAIGLIAGHARKNFGVTILFQRDPASKVDFLINGDLRFQYEGAVAEEFLSTLDDVQAKLEAGGHAYTKEDIALATIIRSVADGSINGEGGDVQGI